MSFWQWLLSPWWGVPPTPKPPVPIPVPVPTPPINPDDPATVASVIYGLNVIRAKHGISAPLVRDDKLCSIAAAYARELADSGTFTHGDWQGRIWRVYPDVTAGEDLAKGQVSAAQVDGDWEQSPGHLRTIIGDYNRVGVGYAKDRDGVVIWVADFVLKGF